MGSLEFLESAGDLPHLLRRLEDGACFPRTNKLMDSTGAWSLRQHPPPLSAPTLGGSGWFCHFLVLIGLPWAAHGSHAPIGMALTPPAPPDLLLLFLYLFVYFIGLICCTLSPYLSLFVFESLWLNTLVKSPSMVTPVLWHLCLEPNGSYLRKHCLRVLSFIGFCCI